MYISESPRRCVGAPRARTQRRLQLAYVTQAAVCCRDGFGGCCLAVLQQVVTYCRAAVQLVLRRAVLRAAVAVFEYCEFVDQSGWGFRC
jgi:hypothetical protein